MEATNARGEGKFNRQFTGGLGMGTNSSSAASSGSFIIESLLKAALDILFRQFGVNK
ncbi:hypothetical protein [Neobacillus drentensis]|uniref:hypothetical protein n=1 Tax=Neobacillus drentensis TaxID=220684 RepID=UPI002FFEF3BF